MLETQELAGIGSFLVDYKDSNNSIYTPQYFNILEFDEQPDYEEFVSYIHADDQKSFTNTMEISLKYGGEYEVEYRYKRNLIEKRIWSKGVVILENDKPALIKGSVRDITKRYRMIQQLEETKRLYKLGQELTLIGNWSWDVNTGRLSWSEEMYRLFEVEDGKPVTMSEFISFVHPDDKEKIKSEIQKNSAPTEKSEYMFKIITPTGSQKKLKGVSMVQLIGQKLITRCYGTCQDVTNEPSVL